MGRPSASPENKAFAVFFSHAITKKSHSRFDFVARSGPLSLFSSLAKLFPAYARTEDGSGFRDGVSEVQLNKELQKNGFMRVRDRRTCAVRRSDDPTGAGMYLFSHLQWRDPNSEEDKEVLVAKYNEMVEKFPLIMLSCKLNRYLDCIAQFHKDWATSNEQMTEVELEEADESDVASESAHRSTSVSPASCSVRSSVGPSAQQLAPTSCAPATPLFSAAPQLNLSNMLNLAPQLSKPFAAPSAAQQRLNALENQLTNSLLAVTLAKQQLSAVNSSANSLALHALTSSDLGMQTGLLGAPSSAASLLQRAIAAQSVTSPTPSQPILPMQLC